ncbi:MAG: ribosomal L7Ae/L30e/S12e/Gadd45 family protein [Candidatus Pacearchaeota archaeon]
MSVKEIKEAYEKDKISFGIKEAIKLHKKKKKIKVFVSKDAREETIKKLEEKNINFEFTKTKKEIAKELGINFESEVYSIK